MVLKVKELHPVFAAEARGLKVGPDLSPSVVEEIEDLMAKYAVLVLPDQKCTDEEQITFSRHFGPRESPLAAATGMPADRLQQYLFDASNLGTDHQILPEGHPRRQLRLGDRLWHSDSSFNPLPTKWSMLSGRIIPPEGGNTEFADARAAYDALPEAKKAMLDDLVAEHSTWYSRLKGGMDGSLIGEKQHQGMPPTLQPVIRMVPRSNRKTIYIGAHAGRITGMSNEAGAALIDELIEWCTQPQFVYSHKWTEGDLVIWDNRCTLHRARPFPDLEYKRDMRRTTVDEFHPAWARLG